MGDTTRLERARTLDVQRFLEEMRALKTRLQNLDLARLEEQRQAALDAASKDSVRRVRSGSSEELHRVREESRRFVDAEHQNSKAIIVSKYEAFDVNLEALGHLLRELAPLRDQKSQLAQEGERLRKVEEELNVRRKVVEREEEDSERKKQLLHAAESAVAKKEKELAEKLANLDVVRRARNLDQLKSDLDSKIKAYETEAQEVVRARDELNRDFEKMGEKRAELDREVESLKEDRTRLLDDRRKLADSIAREFAANFEAFVRDTLNPPRGKEI